MTRSHTNLSIVITATCCHNISTSGFDGIIPLMRGHLHLLPLLPSKNVKAAVVLTVQVLAAYHGPYLSIRVQLPQLGSLGVLVVVQVYYVICRPAHVLLCSLVYISFNFESVLLQMLLVLMFIPLDLLSLQSFLSQIVQLRLLLIKLPGSYLLIHFRKILVKTLSLYKMTYLNKCIKK